MDFAEFVGLLRMARSIRRSNSALPVTHAAPWRKASIQTQICQASKGAPGSNAPLAGFDYSPFTVQTVWCYFDALWRQMASKKIRASRTFCFRFLFLGVCGVVERRTIGGGPACSSTGKKSCPRWRKRLNVVEDLFATFGWRSRVLTHTLQPLRSRRDKVRDNNHRSYCFFTTNL
jgi:hypothetical protein